MVQLLSCIEFAACHMKSLLCAQLWMHAFITNCMPIFSIQTIATLRRELNLACGGSGSEVLQASEIITLLLMAICAFIF